MKNLTESLFDKIIYNDNYSFKDKLEKISKKLGIEPITNAYFIDKNTIVLADSKERHLFTRGKDGKFYKTKEVQKTREKPVLVPVRYSDGYEYEEDPNGRTKTETYVVYEASDEPMPGEFEEIVDMIEKGINHADDEKNKSEKETKQSAESILKSVLKFTEVDPEAKVFYGLSYGDFNSLKKELYDEVYGVLEIKAKSTVLGYVKYNGSLTYSQENEVTSSSPGRMYLSNGDPGYPAEEEGKVYFSLEDWDFDLSYYDPAHKENSFDEIDPMSFEDFVKTLPTFLKKNFEKIDEDFILDLIFESLNIEPEYEDEY